MPACVELQALSQGQAQFREIGGGLGTVNLQSLKLFLHDDGIQNKLLRRLDTFMRGQTVRFQGLGGSSGQ